VEKVFSVYYLQPGKIGRQCFSSGDFVAISTLNVPLHFLNPTFYLFAYFVALQPEVTFDNSLEWF
jgi:hypothetical protein